MSAIHRIKIRDGPPPTLLLTEDESAFLSERDPASRHFTCHSGLKRHLHRTMVGSRNIRQVLYIAHA